jgi:hypothetical protein
MDENTQNPNPLNFNKSNKVKIENNSNSSGAFLLMVGIIVAAIILSYGLRNIKEKGESITVKGYAEMTIKSDLAVWRITINSRKTILSESYNNLVSSKSKIREYLAKNGISDKVITESSLSSYTIYDNINGTETSNVKGYNMSQSIIITTNDIQKVTQLSLKINELLSEGIEFNSNPPEYYVSDIGKYKMQMLGEALKDAQKRAEVIAKSVGNSISGIKYAKQGIFQITPLNSTEISDWGVNDVSSIEKSIKSVVDAAFYIK